VANDFGYDFVFSRYLESHATKGDCLVALTTSGNSKNVIKAVEFAQQEGITSIVLSGRVNPDLAAISDLYICTAGGQYADRVQELHIKLLHIFIEQIERHFHPDLYSE
jgi:D-sedoheptulose 7-phosphate isomerase